MEPKNMDRKDIKKLAGNGEVKVNGFYRNMGQFGVSYLLFADNEVFSLSGFGAKQFDDVSNELLYKTFILSYETKKSKTYGKNYVVVKAVKVIDGGDSQGKLKVEYE